MKYQAVHDRKSVHVVAFLGNNALICENDEKKQNNVSDDILQYLQTELLDWLNLENLNEWSQQ